MRGNKLSSPVWHDGCHPASIQAHQSWDCLSLAALNSIRDAPPLLSPRTAAKVLQRLGVPAKSPQYQHRSPCSLATTPKSARILLLCTGKFSDIYQLFTWLNKHPLHHKISTGMLYPYFLVFAATETTLCIFSCQERQTCWVSPARHAC